MMIMQISSQQAQGMNNCVEWVEQVIDGQRRMTCTKLYADLSNERLIDGIRWVWDNVLNIGIVMLIILSILASLTILQDYLKQRSRWTARK